MPSGPSSLLLRAAAEAGLPPYFSDTAKQHFFLCFWLSDEQAVTVIGAFRNERCYSSCSSVCCVFGPALLLVPSYYFSSSILVTIPTLVQQQQYAPVHSDTSARVVVRGFVPAVVCTNARDGIVEAIAFTHRRSVGVVCSKLRRLIFRSSVYGCMDDGWMGWPALWRFQNTCASMLRALKSVIQCSIVSFASLQIIMWLFALKADRCTLYIVRSMLYIPPSAVLSRYS